MFTVVTGARNTDVRLTHAHNSEHFLGSVGLFSNFFGLQCIHHTGFYLKELNQQDRGSLRREDEKGEHVCSRFCHKSRVAVSVE